MEYHQFRQLILDNYQNFIEEKEEQKFFMSRMDEIRNKQDHSYTISKEILRLHKETYSLTLTECIKLVQYLYNRYIDNESLICVNISCGIREQIVNAYMEHYLIPDDCKSTYTAKTRKDLLPMMVIHTDDFEEQTSDEKSTGNAVDRSVTDMITSIMETFECASSELFELLRKESWRRFVKSEQYKKFMMDMNDNDNDYQD